MEIRIISVHVSAIVDGQRVEKHFQPEEQGLPGLITEIFRNIKIYLSHNHTKQEPKS